MIYRIIICLLVVVSSCTRYTTTDLFKNCDFGSNTEVCLILPEVGCGDCIAGGLSFLMKNKDKFSKDQSKNKVIFTALTSIKMLKRELGDIDIKSLNCEIDSVNRFLLSPPDGLYPVIVYLKEGEIQNIDIQNPQNANVLKSLSDIL